MKTASKNTNDVFVAEGDGQSGPFSREQLSAMWREGSLTREAYYWQEGLDTWQPLIHFLTPRFASAETSPSDSAKVHSIAQHAESNTLPLSLSELRPVADAGDADAKGILALLGKLSNEDALALANFSASAGSPFGFFALGRMHDRGQGVSKDQAVADSKYASALPGLHAKAQAGHAWAQYFLSSCYAMGVGVEQDDRASADWVLQSAKQGLAEAQNVVSRNFAEGYGVKKDEVAAVSWAWKSVEQGSADGATLLGTFYLSGSGVSQNTAKAVEWLKKAVDGGESTARTMLALALIKDGNPKEAARVAKCIIDDRDSEEDDKNSAQEILDIAASLSQ